jgi:prepilin-type N-terminal cleavage/methylation domain-containing protein
MQRRVRNRGFTVTEIMVVTTLVSLLAMMSTAAVQRLGKHAESAAYWNDARVFAEAFGRYAQERGSYPEDQTVTGEVPAGMSDYLRTTNWLRITPLGGRYEWDNKDATNSLGVVFNAAIKVTGCSWTITNLLRLDQLYDDGNLTTGNIIVTDAGTTVFFVIERRTS